MVTLIQNMRNCTLLAFAIGSWLALLSDVPPSLLAAQKTGPTQHSLDQFLINYQFQFLDTDGLLRETLAGKPVTLQVRDRSFEVLLESRDLRAARYQSVESLPNGERRLLERQPVRTFRGSLPNGQGQARVSFVDGTLEAVILTPEEWYFVEPLSRYSAQALKGDMVVYERSDIRSATLGDCGLATAERLVEGIEFVTPFVADAATTYTVELATEADNEYVTALGSSDNAANEILDILNQVEGVYQSELGLTFEVVFQHSWNTTSDPYSSTAASTILQEFTSHWNSNFSNVNYDLAHMWTGKNLDGSTVGIAWKGVSCTKSYAYGVSQRLTGTPAKSILTAHEMGHNFGGDHVSTSNPGQGDCGNTIMNPSIGTGFSFCPFSRDQIGTHVSQNSGCLGQQQPVAAPAALTASAVSSSQLAVSWQHSGSGITGFKIQRKTGSSGNWSQVGQTVASVTAYADGGLSPNTTYYYRVAATNGSSDSAFSNEANATTAGSGATISSFSPASGTPGTQVTIQGTGFTGVTGVQFNGTNASYTPVSASQILAQVPASASTGLIRVTTSSSSATSASAFVVTSCSISLSSTSQTIGAAGGIGNFTVSAPNGCSWTATSSSSWITITSGIGGSGNGTVGFSVGVNSGAGSRAGSIVVAGQTVTITQLAGSSGSNGELTLFVPVVLSSSGMNGSYFTSEMTLTNRGSQNANLMFTYAPAFGSGAGSATDTLGARQQRVVTDAIGYLRSLGVPIPASGSQGGTLTVRFSGLASVSDGGVSVRTTTSVDGGRAGLAYSGVAGSQALSGPVILAGLRQNQQDRSNVAIQNTGGAIEGNITLRVSVYSGDPLNRQTFTLADQVLAPGGFVQFSGILQSNDFAFSNGYVRVERVSGTAPFYTYGVINDQLNSDGSFVPPIPEAALNGRTQLTLPVVVEVNDFSSELVLTNWNSSARTLQCSYVASGIQAPNSTATFQMTLLPSEQIILSDFVQKLREMNVAGIGPKGSPLVGPLMVTPQGGDLAGIAVAARTSAPGATGRFGLFYSGIPNGMASSGSVWLHGLLQNAENRTNLAIVNTGEVDSSSDRFRIEIYNGSSGSLAATIDDFTVTSRSWSQISSILSLYAPGTQQGYARITRISGNNPFIAYAVINDGGQPGQRTGDGAFLLSTP